MSIGNIVVVILVMALLLETIYILTTWNKSKVKSEEPSRDPEELQELRDLFDSAYPEFMDEEDDNPNYYVLAADVNDDNGDPVNTLGVIGVFLLEVIFEVYPQYYYLTPNSVLPSDIKRHDIDLIVAFLEKVAREGCKNTCFWYVHPLDTNQYILTEAEGYEIVTSSSSLITITN